MQSLKLNETPVRTSRNFGINNIKLENVSLPYEIGNFNNIKIINETSKIRVEQKVSDFKLTYGVGDVLEDLKSNQNLRIIIDSKYDKEIEIDFKFDKNNINLIENIEIIANENSKGTVILKYNSEDENIKSFHNGIIRVIAKGNSNVNVIVANLINDVSNNFISIENNCENDSNVNYTLIDFGGKNSITNYYSNLIRRKFK